MNRGPQQIRIIVIVICLVILASGGFRGLMLGTVGEGYTTGYEGAKANFYGIEWNYKTQHGKTSFPLKGTTFHFDADENDKPRTGACNLEGEMTSVFLPEGSRPSSWVDPSWWDTATEYIKNPVQHYEWEIEEGNTTNLYAMDEYKLKWYFSISAEWDKLDVIYSTDREYMDQRYSNTQIWFEFNLAPIWYFEGTSTCYFSIAKIRLSDISLTGKLDNQDETEASQQVRVVPMSSGSILPIYYNAFGVANDRAEKEAYVFKDKKLNPDLFTDKVYAYFTLADFGTKYWMELGGLVKHWKGDVVTVGFDIHVFVVGEWKVQDIQEIPEDYGRTSKTGAGGFTFLEQLARILAGPEFKMWFILGIIAIVLLVLAIFAPWVLFAIFGLLKSSKRKS